MADAEDDTGSIEPGFPGAEQLGSTMGPYASYLAKYGGYEPHQIAGILGTLQQESPDRANPGDLDANAINPSSKAQYIPQWLDRKPAYEAWANSNGYDKTNPLVQAKYTLRELATTEQAADKQLRASKDYAQSAEAWRSFERAGTDYGGAHIKAAQKLDAQFKQAAQNVQPAPNEPVAAPTPDLNQALSRVQQKLGGNQPPGAPAAQPVQSVGDPLTSNLASTLSRVQKTINKDPAEIMSRYGVQPAPSTMSGVAHFFQALPQSALRGLADQAGFPVDLLNAGASYYAHNPVAIAGMEGVGPPIEWGGGQQNLNSLITGQTSGQQQTQGVPPGQPGPQLPGGSSDVRKLMGKIGINTNLPSEEGDTSPEAGWAQDLGYAVGATSPLGLPGVIRGIAQKSLPMILKQVGGDLALGASSGGMGRVLDRDVMGSPGEVNKPIGQVAGPVMLTGALKAGGAMTAARYLMVNGLHAAEASGSPTVENIIKGQLNAGAQLDAMTANPEAAVRNVANAAGISGPGAALPEGFQVPAATASMDQSTQALMHNVKQQDMWLHGQFNHIVGNNEQVLEAHTPLGVGTGTEGDAAQQLSQIQEARINAKQQSLSQAVQQADRDFQVATHGTAYDPDEAGTLKRAYDANLKGQLQKAYAESQATTKGEFETAKNTLQGASVPTTRLYDNLASMMSDAIKSGNAKHFPETVISELYDKPPLGMFDKDGNLVTRIGQSKNFRTQTETTNNLTGDISNTDVTKDINTQTNVDPATNKFLGNTAPWAQLHGLYSDVDNELSQLVRKGGDPDKAKYLLDIKGEIETTMRDLRVGGKFAPGELPAALQNALNSSAENKRLFIDSPVGSYLGLNNYGMPTGGGKDITSWLANTPETVNKVQSMFDALAPGSLAVGVHPADVMKQEMDKLLRQNFADAYRAGGASTANQMLNKYGAVLDHPAFSPLRDDFRTALNSRQVSSDLSHSVPKDIAELRRSRAELFTDNDVGTALDVALKGNNKFTATNQIIDDLKQDPTGKALEGFANAAYERMLAKVTTSSLDVGKRFDGAMAEKYYHANQGMFEAIDRALLGTNYKANVEQFVNGAKMMDNIMHKPEGVPLNRKEIEFSVTGMGGLLARIVGADLGRKLGTGTIQVPGIMSNLASSAYSSLFKNMPAERAASLISRAMIEPETYMQLMQPMVTPQAAQQTSKLLAPYIAAGPGIVYNTNQQYNNPQPPMQKRSGTYLQIAPGGQQGGK